MWLYVPSCQSVPVSQDSIKESTSQQEPKLFVTLSGKPTQQPLSWRGWKTRPWSLPLFGTISQPLMASLGAGKWIASLPDFHANLGVLQERNKELPIQDGSGTTSGESFARYDRDTSSWRTCQVSCVEELNTFCGRWPKAGTLRNGVVSVRKKSDSPTKEKGCLSLGNWRTPSASDSDGGVKDLSNPKSRDALAPKIKLRGQSVNWRSPQARDVKSAGKPNQPSYQRRVSGERQLMLNDQSVNWPSPVASDAGTGAIIGKEDQFRKTSGLPRKINRNGKDGSLGLARLVLFQSPLPQIAQNANVAENLIAKNMQDISLNVNASARQKTDTNILSKTGSCGQKLFPTPNSRDVKGHAPLHRKDGKSRATDQLPNCIEHTFYQVTMPQQNGGNCSKQSRRLNPLFVERLMGLPTGWSMPIPIEKIDYERWGMESCHLLRGLLSQYYTKG